jgi:hypothetical protein
MYEWVRRINDSICMVKNGQTHAYMQEWLTFQIWFHVISGSLPFQDSEVQNLTGRKNEKNDVHAFNGSNFVKHSVFWTKQFTY